MKVSVCIPTFKYGRFIAETIESILCQTCTDFELLIIDDNSPDDTADIVSRYAQQDARIRFSVNPENLGMVKNWNYCLSQARGDYIKFVFGDDLLAAPDALNRMVSRLDSDQTISLVASARYLIDERSAVLSELSGFSKDCTLSGPDVINYCLSRQKNLIGEPSVTMFRRNQATRGFNENYQQIVDLEMWFHLLEQGRFSYISDRLCSFRVHQKQQTARNNQNLGDINDVPHLLEDYAEKPYITLSYFMKAYLCYDHLHGIWKRSQHDQSRQQAVRTLISDQWGLVAFWGWYPMYKVFKPFLKLYKMLIQPM
ncbi:MAG: glycosyltransferase family 2 protein [Desulfuromonadales bacterium]|nr:glycosyltransferase family 2 protein [Desulfuromonadales bacterium]